MSYNNSVLIGNWSEERLKNEYEFMLFLRKRDRRELLLQKSRTLFSNLLKERPLAISGTYVNYGFNVQLVASDMPAKATVAGEKRQYGLALSSLVQERQVDYMQNINDGCLMTLSPIITPCCRNTFVILSAKGENHRGGKMNYGDEFLLKAENYGDPEAAPLYVRYTPSGTPAPADRMPICLSATKDSNCRWTTMPLLACDRLEGLGSAVKTGARLIIKNCVADKSLCVMNQNWMQTFFGPDRTHHYIRFDNPQILAKEHQFLPRMIREAIEIKKHPNFNREDGWVLPPAWDPVINIIKSNIKQITARPQDTECGVTCRTHIDIHGRHTAENVFTIVSDVATKTKE